MSHDWGWWETGASKLSISIGGFKYWEIIRGITGRSGLIDEVHNLDISEQRLNVEAYRM